ncbi:MAG: hypothetical protein IJ087_09260 [Eggerthellaceae bacterium]|nr:hypothetical protein [Eggerthellaceae bacterium]
MAEYAFAPDEYVVLKAQEVRLDEGKSFSVPRPGELMLTNRNIVLPRKGLTGKVKGYEVYPLADIRLVNGAPQCRLDTSDFMDVKLEIALRDRLVTFVFGGLDGKKEVRAWINAIYQILLGQDAPEEALGKGKFESLFDEENIADAVGRVYGSFENAFQRKRNEAAADVSMRCPSCNASLKGRPGATVACPYCGSYVTLPQVY